MTSASSALRVVERINAQFASPLQQSRFRMLVDSTDMHPRLAGLYDHLGRINDRFLAEARAAIQHTMHDLAIDADHESEQPEQTAP